MQNVNYIELLFSDNLVSDEDIVSIYLSGSQIIIQIMQLGFEKTTWNKKFNNHTIYVYYKFDADMVLESC